ncbi:MAG: phosphotransferase [Gammaproteobacteria bacterium]|nr:phosphotransferase [Gammaproteobacteria bacterium]
MTEQSTLDVVPVLAAHQFDTAALERYLHEHVDGFAPELTVTQFQGGMSNPTFMLTDGAQRRYVLRKKPPGKLLPSAHAVDREYRVISALGASDVPVPRTLVLCEDDSVIGTAFYVMEHVEGRVFIDPRIPKSTPSERSAIYDAMNAALAALHRVDYAAVGLDDFGRVGGYCQRQVKRWSAQYVASKTDELQEMEDLMAWLPAHMPSEDPTSVVHGDYRLGNIVFHPTEPRVVSVLDWELSTLGHPLADLAYNCLQYYMDDPRGDLSSESIADSGIPDEAAYLEAYCQRTGRQDVGDWRFFLVLSLFRLAAISQGVYHRGLQGNASDPRALERKDKCRSLSSIAWRLVAAK